MNMRGAVGKKDNIIMSSKKTPKKMWFFWGGSTAHAAARRTRAAANSGTQAHKKMPHFHGFLVEKKKRREYPKLKPGHSRVLQGGT